MLPLARRLLGNGDASIRSSCWHVFSLACRLLGNGDASIRLISHYLLTSELLGRGLADQQDGCHTVRLCSAGDAILPFLLVSSHSTPVSHWERRRETRGGYKQWWSAAQKAEIVLAGLVSPDGSDRV
ncbi:hypothetical protein NDU88_005698 [Pleurodeles waltl]|uniref:Uncharacterized protein n=1 Tax=Pleurodeles waltl TaxID=8319 RepID=A0AAV7PPB6_PLEWA|nr:hypothetical protein NDU88_005698 [Pleurodeles waltl]